MAKEIIETDIVIIGAGPVGLFTVFEAGLLGLNCHLIDNLDKVGGQCIELYPEKPIYDIPGVANQTGKEHIDALLEQIKPFDYETHLNQRVDVLEELPDNFWKVITNKNIEFKTKNVFIAAGAGAPAPAAMNTFFVLNSIFLLVITFQKLSGNSSKTSTLWFR